LWTLSVEEQYYLLWPLLLLATLNQTFIFEGFRAYVRSVSRYWFGEEYLLFIGKS
jgi:peptidoglycan/LPS O-acetylase OafA/YrhL